MRLILSKTKKIEISQYCRYGIDYLKEVLLLLQSSPDIEGVAFASHLLPFINELNLDNL